MMRTAVPIPVALHASIILPRSIAQSSSIESKPLRSVNKVNPARISGSNLSTFSMHALISAVVT
jgi:hypothetical protein